MPFQVRSRKCSVNFTRNMLVESLRGIAQCHCSVGFKAKWNTPDNMLPPITWIISLFTTRSSSNKWSWVKHWVYGKGLFGPLKREKSNKVAKIASTGAGLPIGSLRCWYERLITRLVSRLSKVCEQKQKKIRIRSRRWRLIRPDSKKSKINGFILWKQIRQLSAEIW